MLHCSSSTCIDSPRGMKQILHYDSSIALVRGLHYLLQYPYCSIHVSFPPASLCLAALGVPISHHKRPPHLHTSSHLTTTAWLGCRPMIVSRTWSPMICSALHFATQQMRIRSSLSADLDVRILSAQSRTDAGLKMRTFGTAVSLVVGRSARGTGRATIAGLMIIRLGSGQAQKYDHI